MIDINHRVTGETIRTVETLRGAYLRDADLRGAYLRDADLSGASLRDADLSSADLSGAYLRDADLSSADLSSASLRGAYLKGAYLKGANLKGAYLKGANLKGADLIYARSYVDLGTDSRGYHFRAVERADGWRISAGCRWFTVPEAIAHWTAAGNRDALARVAIVAAHCG